MNRSYRFANAPNASSSNSRRMISGSYCDVAIDNLPACSTVPALTHSCIACIVTKPRISPCPSSYAANCCAMRFCKFDGLRACNLDDGVNRLWGKCYGEFQNRRFEAWRSRNSYTAIVNIYPNGADTNRSRVGIGAYDACNISICVCYSRTTMQICKSSNSSARQGRPVRKSQMNQKTMFPDTNRQSLNSGVYSSTAHPQREFGIIRQQVSLVQRRALLAPSVGVDSVQVDRHTIGINRRHCFRISVISRE